MGTHRLKIWRFAALFALAALLAIVAVASAKTSTFTVKMTGAQEAPKADGGSGTVTLRLNPGTGKVCWTFSNLKKVPKPQVSHIHKGRKGVSGPVVVPLGGKFKMKGCTTASKAMVKAIVKKPSGYYVNVHNAKFPNGAVRGQL